MKHRSDDTLAFDRVAQVVRSWDPDGLLAGGAPANEFDPEIARIAARIPRIQTPADAARVVAEVFFESFEPEPAALQRCAEVGRRLHAELAAAGLLRSPN